MDETKPDELTSDSVSDNSPQSNEKKEVAPKLANLPTLSVSSPSPPHEEKLL